MGYVLREAVRCASRYLQVALSHPAATRIVLITDAVQNSRPYSLYEPASTQRSQAIKKFEPKVEIERLASVALPALNRGVVVNIFPVGQPEPTAEGLVHRRLRRRGGPPHRALALYLRKCGAAPASTVTSFVPAE